MSQNHSKPTDDMTAQSDSDDDRVLLTPKRKLNGSSSHGGQTTTSSKLTSPRLLPRAKPERALGQPFPSPFTLISKRKRFQQALKNAEEDVSPTGSRSQRSPHDIDADNFVDEVVSNPDPSHPPATTLVTTNMASFSARGHESADFATQRSRNSDLTSSSPTSNSRPRDQSTSKKAETTIKQSSSSSARNGVNHAISRGSHTATATQGTTTQTTKYARVAKDATPNAIPPKKPPGILRKSSHDDPHKAAKSSGVVDSQQSEVVSQNARHRVPLTLGIENGRRTPPPHKQGSSLSVPPRVTTPRLIKTLPSNSEVGEVARTEPQHPFQRAIPPSKSRPRVSNNNGTRTGAAQRTDKRTLEPPGQSDVGLATETSKSNAGNSNSNAHGPSTAKASDRAISKYPEHGHVDKAIEPSEPNVPNGSSSANRSPAAPTTGRDLLRIPESRTSERASRDKAIRPTAQSSTGKQPLRSPPSNRALDGSTGRNAQSSTSPSRETYNGRTGSEGAVNSIRDGSSSRSGLNARATSDWRQSAERSTQGLRRPDSAHQASAGEEQSSTDAPNKVTSSKTSSSKASKSAHQGLPKASAKELSTTNQAHPNLAKGITEQFGDRVDPNPGRPSSASGNQRSNQCGTNVLGRDGIYDVRFTLNKFVQRHNARHHSFMKNWLSRTVAKAKSSEQDITFPTNLPFKDGGATPATRPVTTAFESRESQSSSRHGGLSKIKTTSSTNLNGPKTIHFSSKEVSVRAYHHCARSHSNELARNDRTLIQMPEDFIDQDEKVQESFENDAKGVYTNGWPFAYGRDRHLSRLQKARQTKDTFTEFLAEVGCSLHDVLRVFLDDESTAYPPAVKEVRKCADENVNFLSRSLESWKPILPLLSDPVASPLLALNVCRAFQGEIGHSMWLVAEMAAGEILEEGENYDSLTLQAQSLCRICHQFCCTRHGNILEGGKSNEDCATSASLKRHLAANNPKWVLSATFPLRKTLEDAVASESPQRKKELRARGKNSKKSSMKDELEADLLKAERKGLNQSRCSFVPCSRYRWDIEKEPYTDPEQTNRRFSKEQKETAFTLLQAHANNPHLSCVIAAALGVPCLHVYYLVQGLRERLPLETMNATQKRRKSAAARWTKKQPLRFKADVNNRERKIFYPCSHEGPCTLANCSCAKQKNHCEKMCGCSKDCGRRFGGCDCKRVGQVCQAMPDCECRRSARECDPDLCESCGVVEILDPLRRHEEGITEGRCSNVDIQRGIPAPLRVGRSEVSGLGLFAGAHIKKGTYLGEYKGQLISYGEARRRVVKSDWQDRQYGFQLNAEQDVDGDQQAGKLRFFNHASKAEIINVKPESRVVNTVDHIVLCTTKDVAEGKEMFFDYGYDRNMLKDFIEKQRKGKGSQSKKRQPLKTTRRRQSSHSRPTSAHRTRAGEDEDDGGKSDNEDVEASDYSEGDEAMDGDSQGLDEQSEDDDADDDANDGDERPSRRASRSRSRGREQSAPSRKRTRALTRSRSRNGSKRVRTQ